MAKGDTLYYSDLNPDLVEPEGLKEYLAEGSWVKASDQTTSAIQFTSDSMYAVEQRAEDAWINRIECLPGEEIENRWGKILRHIKSEESDTLWARPAGPDSLIWMGPTELPVGTLTPLKRANRDVRKAARTYRRKQRQQREQQFGIATQGATLQPRGNQMKLDGDVFTVPAGESVEVIFENTATNPSMRHNVVILNKAPSGRIFQRVGEAGVDAGAASDYVPEMDDLILAHTPVAKPGETVSVTFTAPEEPGDYGFVCTYPGHWATGQGTMQVVRE